MPTQGFYLDADTYRLAQEEAAKQGRKIGEIVGESVRIELQKRASEETRPKFCGGRCADFKKLTKEFENEPLEWHLTGQEQACLYCICPTCGWKYNTDEIYKTNILG